VERYRTRLELVPGHAPPLRRIRDDGACLGDRY
jgi:hypothetical protein